jgi:acetoin utilization deacetylase AcuC-like enzyme/S-formylglutathione hydrolase FrmB
MLLLGTLLSGVFFAAARVLSAADPAPSATLQGGVAAVEIGVKSEAMGRSMPALVLLPPSYARRPAARYPVLYLLHCAGGDYRMWVQGTGLIRELASRELIVVCPEGTPLGWYLDSPVRPRSAVETHLVRELIPQIDREFRTLAARSGRAIGGYSMGGHGAITLAAKHPDLFASAGSLGGILDLPRWPGQWGLDAVLGPLATGREVWIAHSAMGLSGRFAKEAAGMKLLIDCGLDDFALPENRAFHRRLGVLGVPHVYREREGGHELMYGAQHLPEHLDFHLAALKEAASAPPATAPVTGYFTHPAFLKHRTGEGHPERPERLTAIETALKQNGIWDRLAHPVPAPASLATLQLVHDADYIATARRDIEAGRTTLSTGDTMVSPESWDAAILAAGAVCDAVDAVLAGKLRNAFCAVRPPGHHACPARGMGFCVFNNIAIGARHALRARGIDRVLVIDWDVHHGNGTQDAFWTDGSVLQFHTQQVGIYPGSGKREERGAGAAEGRILNFPIEFDSGIEVFAKLYTERLAPAARAFKPQLILVSAGYDSHADDPLGGLALRSEDFGRLTRMVLDLADELCQGRVVIALEGGYDLNALGASATATIAELDARGRAVQLKSVTHNPPVATAEQPMEKTR